MDLGANGENSVIVPVVDVSVADSSAEAEVMAANNGSVETEQSFLEDDTEESPPSPKEGATKPESEKRGEELIDNEDVLSSQDEGATSREEDEDDRRPRRRKSTIKRKRRVNAAAAASSGEQPKGGDGGEQRRFSQRLRDKSKKESERQKRAARWVNLCIEAVYEDDAAKDVFLRKWMEALNRHVAEQQATEAVSLVFESWSLSLRLQMLNGCILFRTQFNELNLTFCEIFSSGLPKLSNFNVTADELGRVVS